MKKFLIFLLIFALCFCSGSIIFAQDNVLSQKVSQLADKLAFAVEGDVLGVRGDTVYINLGQESGIVEGIPFEVVRLDKDRPFKMGDRIIGYPETGVGQIEITAVRKEMSLAKIKEQVADIQEGDKVYQQMKKVTRIAITEFTYGDEFNSFTRNVQDILYTNLIQRGMTVVEREKMEQVMEELAQTFSGMIDTSTAAEIGKMLGVEAVIVGTVADMGNSVDLRARLVDVEQGTAITAAQITVTKDPTITGLLEGDIRRTTVSGGRSSGGQRDSTVIQEVIAKDFNFKLINCERKGESVIFEFLITSEGNNSLSIALKDGNYITRIFDNSGNEYFTSKIQLGKYYKTSYWVDNNLVAGIPMKAIINFEKFSSHTENILLLEFWCYADGKRFRVEFRDIPITE
jgi:TolB-like protein